jgi:MFS family permease
VSDTATALAPGPRAEAPEIKRHHLIAAVTGNALEFYDFTTYAFFAVQIGRAFFPGATDMDKLLLSLATFGAGFASRPFGGLLIGRYADRVGRRPAMLLSFSLMGGAILALALVPSYASIGIAAPLLVILARLVQGFALGGEIGPTTAFLIEAAPVGARGLYASWQGASQSIASMAAGLIGVILSLVLTQASLDLWGWRIAFLIGAITLPFGLAIRRSLPETLHHEEELPTHHPFVADQPFLLRHGRTFLLGLFLVANGTIATYVVTYITTYARTTLQLTPLAAFGATLVAGSFGLVAGVFGGWLSDRIGRKSVTLWGRASMLLFAYPAFYFMSRNHDAATLLLMSALLGILVNLPVTATWVAEALPKVIRGGGFATVYSTAIAIFGGTTQFVIAWLINETGNPLAPAWYLIVATVVGVIAVALMGETAPAIVHGAAAED